MNNKLGLTMANSSIKYRGDKVINDIPPSLDYVTSKKSFLQAKDVLEWSFHGNFVGP